MNKPLITALSILLFLWLVVACNSSELSEETQHPHDEGLEETGELLPSPHTTVIGILDEPDMPCSDIYVINRDGLIHRMNDEDVLRVFEILSTMEATEVLTPFHYEGQFSDPMFTLEIKYEDNPEYNETVYSSEAAGYYYRFTDTVGDQGDKGYVGGNSMALHDILSKDYTGLDAIIEP